MTTTQPQKQVQGFRCADLSNTTVELLVPHDVGPRILSLKAFGGNNWMAQLPDFTLDCPGSGTMHVRGGHRLWHAPEVPARTYLPDSEPVEIVQNANTLTVQQAADASHLQKTLSITLPDESATVVMDNTLTNRGLWSVPTAPWVITQLRTGGMAILPQNTSFNDPAGLQSNRSIAFWPYTNVASKLVQWGNQFILFRSAITGDEAWKIGFPNRVGWLGYWIDGQLFVKSAEYDPSAYYYDYQSSSHFYCNAHFVELETLGPRTMIEPGASVTHRETWHIFDNVEPIVDEQGAAELVERLAIKEQAYDDHAAT